MNPQENKLTHEEKAQIKDRIRRFLAATRPKEKAIDTFKRTFLWMLEASSVIQMMELTKKAVTGRFVDVARYLEKGVEEEFEDD